MIDILITQLRELTTPHLADACLRAGVPVRYAPAGVRPIAAGMRCAGRARPVRHVGSIDVFLDALQGVENEDVLVVDNDGRLDEACIGDLIAREAKDAGLAGIVIWGLHRDSPDIRAIGLPFFSMGTLPSGPQRLDPRPVDVFARAMVGTQVVTSSDLVAADDDGILFLPEVGLDAVVAAAETIRDTEHRQVAAMAAGRSLRSQVRFSDFVSRRARQAGYSFREYLREIAAAGEE